VYSYGVSSGELRWSHGTGSYVYGSPAVYQRRVYVGSYDGSFYALDAATGDVAWRFAANGPISGSATVVDGLVYFSTLRRRTYALDADTGAARWTFRDGAYAGVVADADRLYAVGVGRLYAFQGRGRRAG
jgi:outer membrane protein assembly factor BamB